MLESLSKVAGRDVDTGKMVVSCEHISQEDLHRFVYIRKIDNSLLVPRVDEKERKETDGALVLSIGIQKTCTVQDLAGLTNINSMVRVKSLHIERVAPSPSGGKRGTSSTPTFAVVLVLPLSSSNHAPLFLSDAVRLDRLSFEDTKELFANSIRNKAVVPTNAAMFFDVNKCWTDIVSTKEFCPAPLRRAFRNRMFQLSDVDQNNLRTIAMFCNTVVWGQGDRGQELNIGIRRPKHMKMKSCVLTLRDVQRIDITVLAFLGRFSPKPNTVVVDSTSGNIIITFNVSNRVLPRVAPDSGPKSSNIGGAPQKRKFRPDASSASGARNKGFN